MPFVKMGNGEVETGETLCVFEKHYPLQVYSEDKLYIRRT